MRYTRNVGATLAICAAMLCPTATIQAQEVFLVVNRTSGSLEVVSNGTLEVDGYEVTSPAGRFSTDGWNSLADQGVAGWEEANPNGEGISELNWAGSSTLEAGNAVALGTPYSGGAILPRQEDVAFRYSQPGNVVNEGVVHYTGPSPLPTVTVDRGTGAISLSNPGNFPITGYSISSSAGSLNADAFNSLTNQGVAGFTEANPLGDLISELSLSGEVGFDGGASFGLGNIYGGGELALNYTTPDGSIAEGVVDFTGEIADLVLQVDLFSGQTKIQNLSSAGPFDVIGYAVTSPSGALSVDGWNSLNAQGNGDWIESNPRVDSIAELNTAGSLLFENGVSVSLGNIFTGTQDLQFEYGTLAGTATGTVEYVLNLGGELPPTCQDVAASRAIAGDLDGDGAVGFSDFLVLSDSFGENVSSYESGDIDCNGNVAFSDFLVLSNNFGQTAGAAASVPEPTTNFLAALAVLLILPLRKRQRSN